MALSLHGRSENITSVANKKKHARVASVSYTVSPTNESLKRDVRNKLAEGTLIKIYH